MNISELKANAKESLKGKYADSIAIIIIMSIITSALIFIVSKLFPVARIDMFGYTFEQSNPIASILEFIISCLFLLGYHSFFLKTSRNEESSINDLWSKFNMFIPCVAVSILIGIIVGLGFILLIVPGIILSLAYSMTYYIMLDNEEISIIEAMRQSRQMMAGHKAELFVLYLSFIGWAILGIFTLGILYFWLIPYVNVTVCNFYNKLKEQ